MLWAHVCVNVHVSVNVCRVNTGAYGSAHLQSPNLSKTTDSFSISRPRYILTVGHMQN